MAKKERLDFDYEDFFNEKLENIAVLMWNTRHPAFTFAFYLNQLYNLNLERRDDIASPNGDESRCTLYSWQSNVDQQAYFLIEQPIDTANAGGTFFDKILLIVGAEVFDTARRIYDETSQTIGIADSPTTPERDEMLRTFVETGIFESALFDFSDPDRPETTYFPSAARNAALQKKQDRFLKEQRDLISDLIIVLDPLLPDFESI